VEVEALVKVGVWVVVAAEVLAEVDMEDKKRGKV
jgi:hypothetical protein